MKAMLASLDDSFLQVRATHRLRKGSRSLSGADAAAVKPAVQVLMEAAHSEKSNSLELLAKRLATLPPDRAARFLQALQTKLQTRAQHAQEVPAAAPAVVDRRAAFLQKQ